MTLDEQIVKEVADWQHLDVFLVAPGRWLAFRQTNGELVGEFYAIGRPEGDELRGDT